MNQVMLTNEELISALRRCAVKGNPNCSGCPIDKDVEDGCLWCSVELMMAASMALEKLRDQEKVMAENWRRSTKLIATMHIDSADKLKQQLIASNQELCDLRVAVHEMEYKLNEHDKANPWVRVSDEMPPADADVWVYGAGSVLYDTPVVAYMDEDGQWYGDDNCLLRNADQLTHWKFYQTPEPPKED